MKDVVFLFWMNPENLKHQSTGTLYIVATPIGNLEDITLRALRVLKEVDLIAAEDTRHTRQLLAHYAIHKPLISYHEHNRKMREDVLIGRLREGENVALVTDAGTPGISDPGEDLVQRVIAEGIPLVPVPGPAALIAALSASGLPTGAFIFHGFLPAKGTQRKKFFQSLIDRKETMVFYESPRRFRSFLEDARVILGDRRAVMAREITKVYEEVVRGKISELLAHLGENEIRGEVTVILEGASSAGQGKPSVREALEFYSREGRAANVSFKEVIQHVARELGIPKREVYRESLRMRGKSEEKKIPPSQT